MVDVALEIDQSGFLLQNTCFMSFRNGVNNGMHVGVAFSNIHVVTDSDRVRHEGNHVGCFANRFAVRNLALTLIQILNFQTQQIAGGSEGKPCPRAVVTEQGDAKTGVKDLGGNVVLAEMTQRVGNGENRFDLVL